MWYWESDVDAESIKYVNSLFHQHKLVQSQGAIGMNLEAEGLGFCLLLKTDGTGLYATEDLELARRKFQDFKIEKSIYVVDLRQALHFKQVFKVLEKLGFPQANNCYHLQYNYVELPDGPMSSRKGNIIPITQLISKMQEIVKNNFLNRYVGDWSQEEIDLVASQVAKGAIKYGMLRIDTNTKSFLTWKSGLRLTGSLGLLFNTLWLEFSLSASNSVINPVGCGEDLVTPLRRKFWLICSILSRWSGDVSRAFHQVLYVLICINWQKSLITFIMNAPSGKLKPKSLNRLGSN